jgi:hypothetical protein
MTAALGGVIMGMKRRVFAGIQEYIKVIKNSPLHSHMNNLSACHPER